MDSKGRLLQGALAGKRLEGIGTQPMDGRSLLMDEQIASVNAMAASLAEDAIKQHHKPLVASANVNFVPNSDCACLTQAAS